MSFKKGHKINRGRIPWNKGMKGLLLNDFFIKNHPRQIGTENPNWKGGIATIGNCLDCGEKLKSYPAKYCLPCSMKYRILPSNAKEKHYRWKGGKPKCETCGKVIAYRANHCSACSKLGEKNVNWNGGVSFEPYTVDWKETLRRAIRQRDKYTCKICGKLQSSDVHHIDYYKKNCNPNNLTTLCHQCHSKTNYKRKYWINYFK